MSEQTNLSKRERQKQRRDVKVAEQQAAAARARRTRLIALVAVVALVAGGVGIFVRNSLAQRSQEQQAVAQATARLGALGCTPDETRPDLGQGHIEGTPQALVAADPAALYQQDRPGSSGQHHPNWVRTGVYDKPVDERLLVHNLEHGYVNFLYSPGAPPEQVRQLKDWAQQQIDGDYQKVVVAEFDQPLPNGANFASLAWGQRQLCRQFDTTVADVFLGAHHGTSGNGPENTLPPHLEPGQGTIDPNAQPGPLLLPPLGQSAPGTGSTSDTGTSEP